MYVRVQETRLSHVDERSVDDAALRPKGDVGIDPCEPIHAEEEIEFQVVYKVRVYRREPYTFPCLMSRREIRLRPRVSVNACTCRALLSGAVGHDEVKRRVHDGGEEARPLAEVRVNNGILRPAVDHCRSEPRGITDVQRDVHERRRG